MYNVNNFFKKTKRSQFKTMVSDISVFFSLKKFFFLAESVSIDFLKTDTEKLIVNS